MYHIAAIMFSLVQLRTFVELARLGSVQETADHLVVSQPAVSAALAGLQREVGVALVERSGRGIRLTPAGRRLAEYGRRLFALLDEAREQTQAAGNATLGRLRVAAVTTAAEHLVPDLLRRYRERHPEIEIELEVGNHERVWDRLAHWEVDLVFAGRPPAGSRFRTLATRAHELVVIAPMASDVPDRGLARATWLVREPGSGSRAATHDLFARLEIEPAQLTVGSNGAIQASVAAGLGVALVSSDAIAHDVERGSFRVLPTRVTPIARQWHVVTSADRETAPSATSFLDFITAARDGDDAPAGTARAARWIRAATSGRSGGL